MKNLLAAVIGLALVFGCDIATASAIKKIDVPPDASTRVLADLKVKYPSTTITSVTKAPMGNLYEVVMGQNVVYVDPDTKYLMFGHIFDMVTQRDLTQARMEDINKIDFAKLPLEKAIKVVKGDGTRTFAVFTDPECPYCQMLEKNLADMNNYTMYVFLYPIVELHPNSRATAEAIWCAKDRAKAWSEAMIDHKFTQSDKCSTPLDQVAELGHSLGVQGTPTMINSDGRRAPGAMPAALMETWLNAKTSSAVPTNDVPSSK